ncbi:hypothetical protein B0T24DRAFT_685614 [Lasiosphaeria ovina]|uniref:Phosphatidylserine decarboxylase n=1 Tax=Lasiosphaeria ovina TaxID=92902 RepID=A0AAE0MXX0_9PEZI|nr:hypothetical protein B0T24DRAFT_685614 [Lasiosphaeria ovina]
MFTLSYTGPDGRPPIVTELVTLARGLANVDMAVTKALDPTTGLPTLLESQGITDGTTFLNWVASFLTWVPSETNDSTKVYDHICIFYCVLDQCPLVDDQTAITAADEYKPLKPLSARMVKFAQQMGQFVNTPSSFSKKAFKTFRESPLYRTYESESSDVSAYQTFNQFFGRRLAKPRTIAGPGDDPVVVYPAEPTAVSTRPLPSTTRTKPIPARGKSHPSPSQWTPAPSIGKLHRRAKTVQAKGIPWDIAALLDGSQHASAFTGGVWAHSFLSTYNYHRLHTRPSDSVKQTLNKGRLIGKQLPAKGGDGLYIDAVDGNGYQFPQTRGWNPTVTVTNVRTQFFPSAWLRWIRWCLSSVPLVRAKTDIVRPTFPFIVQKGDPLAMFQFGGSDIIVVF